MESLDSEVFRLALAAAIGYGDASKAVEAMHSEPSVSIRLNPSKPVSSPLGILEGAVAVPWSPCGYLLGERPVFTLQPLFHAGAYYVQDSSAMFVGWLFRSILDRFPQRPLKVLDLCAAPGGKTTDLAASLREVCGDEFLLVANEVMRQRASVLSDNVAVWGDPNVMVTSVDPKAFARFEGFFDIVVIDAPCSGEGMFRKDAKAVGDWSPETVSLCASRQKRIIADVWPSLKADGALVYSTCTFEPAENDDNLLWTASELGGEVIGPRNPFGIRTTSCGHLLIPGEVPGEGQWAGVLIKSGGSSGGNFLSMASSMDRLKSLRPLRAGVIKGEMKGKDFVPSADWALSITFDRNAYPEAEVNEKTALRFLHRDTIALPEAPLGYNVITYCGLPFGFVKNLGPRCNNLHPQSRRIRMDI